VKKYECSRQDQFTIHFDAQGSASARALAMIWYLNDVKGGGETVFPYFDTEIKPSQGSCLIFPPFWNYMHLARKPESNDKITLNSFGGVKPN
jgi:hypothetical protein